MTKEAHQHRKNEHLSLAFKQWEKGVQSNFSNLRLVPKSLPELALTEINLSTDFLGQAFEVPFYIEAMTGGSEIGDALNVQLAEIAKNQHVALAVGSQSIALKYPELAAGFAKVRKLYPSGFLFANLGAGHGLEEAKQAVAMIDANALELHVNAEQELAMKESEGDCSFYWLDHINEIAAKLDVPVIVKEVGFGMSQETFKQLEKTSIAAVNVGGRGGTNFAAIEARRGGSSLGSDSDEWDSSFGFSTVESLIEAQLSRTTKPLIATGGIRTSQDIVKSLVLGAQMTSSAGFVLQTLMTMGLEKTEEVLDTWKKQLYKLYALLGARNLQELQKTQTIANLIQKG